MGNKWEIKWEWHTAQKMTKMIVVVHRGKVT